MKFSMRLLTALCAAVALFVSGCSSSDSHEKVLDDAAAQLDKLAKTLDGVTDKASAEKAAKEMKSIADELKKVAVRAQALGQPPVDVKAKIENKMGAIAAKFAEKMEAQGAKKTLPPEATQAFADSAKDVLPTMQEVAAAFTTADKK